MIAVTIMKKKRTRVGTFKNMGVNIPGGNYLGENFPGGNSPGRSFIGGNFLGGSFPVTGKNICEEFSSIHALKLIFIRKIVILHTHSLRVYSPTNENFFPWCWNISSSFSTFVSTDWLCKCSYCVLRDIILSSHM